MTSNYIQYNLSKSTAGYNKAMDEMSSGSKLTSVADDPIGTTKAAKLSIQLSANTKELANIAQGQDVLGLAEGNQSLVIDNLQRIRDLTMQASNESYTASDKDAMLSEIRARLSEINNIANTTKYNSVKLLDGSASNFVLQIGASSSSSLNIGSALINVHTAALGVDIGAVTGSTWTTANSEAYLNTIDTAINTVSTATAKIGGYNIRLDDAASSLTSIADGMTSSKSLISDSDVATTSSDIVKYQILQQASVSILTQANQIAALALNLLGSS